MIKIYISPSNHGIGQNKCLRSGCYEDKHTRPIAEVCKKYLLEKGYRVEIGTTSQNMATRVKKANDWGADLYVPIHTNASSDSSSRYLLFMFYSDNDEYRAIFNAVAPFLEEIYPEKKNAQFSVRTDLYEINSPKAKTLYCEMGFHTNQTDVDNFIHANEKIGKALADGILKYFGENVTDVDNTKKEGGYVAVSMPVIKRGSTGAAVKTLQRICYCYFSCPADLKIDGDFGAITDKYCKKLQAKIGCAQDGIAGTDTWNGALLLLK